MVLTPGTCSVEPTTMAKRYLSSGITYFPCNKEILLSFNSKFRLPSVTVPKIMKFQLPCILAFFTASAQGFVAPSSSLLHSNANVVSTRLATSVPMETSWKDLQQFNIALDIIAEECSNTRKPVVSKAADCEEIWRTQTKRNGDIQPDTISFNTVLKAWNRCCGTLAECNRSKITIPTDYKCSIDVYTPLDAARHATTLLLEQENPPLDVASYNIVIGK